MLVDLTVGGAWAALEDRYNGGTSNAPLARVFEIARAHGVVNILIEHRYIDQDWRSEHANFYGTKFERYPSVCHRLHFFTEKVPADLDNLSALQDHYRGYSVLRPLPSSPVGRTMLIPPPDMAGATLCSGSEVVDVVGWPLSVTAMPFVSQDAQFLRCAHADIWMVSHHAHLRFGTKRVLPAAIQKAASGGVVSVRQVPSEGLNVHQMLNALGELGFSPGATALPATDAESRAADWRSLYAIICRYVNSNIPPIVVGVGHVWVMVGYQRKASPGHAKLTLVRHDDALGPYMPVADPFSEPIPEHSLWNQVLLPLPPKIYLNGERAEATGRWWFSQWIAGASAADPIASAAAAGELSYVTYGLHARAFKHGMVGRPSMDNDLKKAYRRSLWPKNIWVVEAQDRRLRSAGKPAVLGEVIIDPTSNHLEPRSVADQGLLSVHGPGLYVAHGPDYGSQTLLKPSHIPYETGLAT